jgi:hypothetical protein
MCIKGTVSRDVLLLVFSTKFQTALKVYSGAWGKLIHEKTRSRKSRDNVPLRVGEEGQPRIGRGVPGFEPGGPVCLVDARAEFYIA